MSAAENPQAGGLPPEWAEKEFCRRANLDRNAILAMADDAGVVLRSAVRAGGQIIAVHESEPHPLLIEARAIVAATLTPANHKGCHCRDEIAAGKWDSGQKVRIALKALATRQEKAQ